MRAMIAILALARGDGRFFERPGVEFWGARRDAPSPSELWPESSAPPPVRRLLEAPTPENARAYLAWQGERLRRLRAAIDAVDAAGRREGAPEILYFSRPGCRFCLLQEAELEGLPVTRVPEGSPAWKEHGVTVTPTLVVAGRVLRGLTPRAAILKELGRE